MLGRLARYLRIVGVDTAYVRGWSDTEILREAGAQGRRIVTRDRDLARRAAGSVLLTATGIEAQWRSMLRAHPEIPRVVAFERCTLCNGALQSLVPGTREYADVALPEALRAGAIPIFSCRVCGHAYWDGSHMQSLRRRLARWSGEPAP
jgi:uncharacterized protein with PIN domain